MCGMPGRVHDTLFAHAFDQYGFVTADDARALDVDRQRLVDMERRGTLERVARGLYRFKAIPHGYRDQLMEAALWPRRARGVLSHDTALDLHDLCDVNPAKIHITVPRRYRINREIPAAYAIHHRDLEREDRATAEGLPTVTPRRAILDAIETHVDPKLVEQAIDTARRRGLVRGKDLSALETQAGGSVGR
jgi:predicted transcriptional regulator of viral defense system